jgi:predicted nucleotidyltransferase
MLGYYKHLLKDFKKITGVVIVYGSVATEKSRPDSDIDIAVFSDDKKAKIMAETIADNILLKYGKVVSIFWLTLNNLEKRLNEPFIQNVLRGEIIHGRKLIKRVGS